MESTMKLSLLVVLASVLCGNSPSLGAQILETNSYTDISLNFNASLGYGHPFQVFLDERMIFDNDTAMESTLSASQLGRFDLQAVSDSITTSITLFIALTREEDSGTYLLRGESMDNDPVEESIDVVVFYPPSNLKCNVSTFVTCRATPGYPAGEITCFQEEQKLISASRNESIKQMLEGIFQFDPDKAVSCCASNRLFMIPQKECNAFVHFPTTGKPRTQGTPVNDTITEHHVATATTAPSDVPKQEWMDKYRATLGNVCALLVITVILYPLALIYHFKIYNHTGKQKKIDTRGEFYPL